MERIFALPLHPLSRNNETQESDKRKSSLKRLHNRQVVQEASMTDIRLDYLGKYEPLNPPFFREGQEVK